MIFSGVTFADLTSNFGHVAAASSANVISTIRNTSVLSAKAGLVLDLARDRKEGEDPELKIAKPIMKSLIMGLF